MQTVEKITVILLIVWGVARIAVSCGWIPNFCPISSSLLPSFRTIDWFVDNEIRQTFLDWLSGNRALANHARVAFHWEEPLVVGNTVSFTIQVLSIIFTVGFQYI